MKIEGLHVGMRVRHPQYGVGTVKTISEATADIQFADGRKTVAPEPSELQPAEPQAAITCLELPLAQVVRQTVDAVLENLGVESPEAAKPLLAGRWHGGKAVFHPSTSSSGSQPKEVPLETFFHKIVGMRNQLRVLEQKINANEKLNDTEKVDLQQYITRCYGSMTTFNMFFREKEDQF
jgi:hypothetical protein